MTDLVRVRPLPVAMDEEFCTALSTRLLFAEFRSRAQTLKAE